MSIHSEYTYPVSIPVPGDDRLGVAGCLAVQTELVQRPVLQLHRVGQRGRHLGTAVQLGAVKCGAPVGAGPGLRG